jgi:hypothetical protein
MDISAVFFILSSLWPSVIGWDRARVVSLNIARKPGPDHYILIFYSLAKGFPTF